MKGVKSPSSHLQRANHALPHRTSGVDSSPPVCPGLSPVAVASWCPPSICVLFVLLSISHMTNSVFGSIYTLFTNYLKTPSGQIVVRPMATAGLTALVLQSPTTNVASSFSIAICIEGG